MRVEHEISVKGLCDCFTPIARIGTNFIKRSNESRPSCKLAKFVSNSGQDTSSSIHKDPVQIEDQRLHSD